MGRDRCNVPFINNGFIAQLVLQLALFNFTVILTKLLIKETISSMCPVLLITFLFSSVRGDYGDIYQMSSNMSVSNFYGSVILTEIERSKYAKYHQVFSQDQFIFQIIWAAPTCAAWGASLSGIVTPSPLTMWPAPAAWPGSLILRTPPLVTRLRHVIYHMIF